MTKHILMIKECQITGLRYLCKSSGKTDPLLYHGSGVRWVNHLRKYHKNWTRSPDIKTTILGEYDTKEELKEEGLRYSKLYNVVEDPSWANLIPEQGDGGLINDQTGKTWKIKDTSKMRNKKTITEKVMKAREHLKGENNHQFIGWYVTPYGKFLSVTEAVQAGIEERKNGNREVITSEAGIRNYCRLKNEIVLNPEGRRIPKNWRGKTPKEVGFSFIPKEDNK